MRIKNISRIKDLLRKKLPEYIDELGLQKEGTKVQCPHSEAHETGDTGKLSAAFLPNTENKFIFCFVENRTFDIFDIYAMRNNMDITGQNFFNVVRELCNKYDIPYEEEIEYSTKEIERNNKRRFIEKLHKISCAKGNIKKGLEAYKSRNLNKDKIKFYKIGYIEPSDITDELNKEGKRCLDYSIKATLNYPALVVPVYDKFNQYLGIILRKVGEPKEEESKYLKFFCDKKSLFNLDKVRGNKEVILTEGVFDAISFYPKENALACLLNHTNDSSIEELSKFQFDKIKLVLDPDNLYKGLARDGFLKSILKMKDFDSDILVYEIPTTKDSEKPDPDDYFKTHSFTDFEALRPITAIQYLLNNYEKGFVKPEQIYDFIASCPNIIRKERYIDLASKGLQIGKKQLAQSVESISDKQSSFNMLQYIQEKDCYEDLLDEFTDSAWNKGYRGISSGFPVFDKKYGGFEDTLYTFIGYPEQGKSAFLLNFVYRLAQNPNLYVGFYSLDDGAKRSILPRLLSIASGLSTKKIKNPEESFKKQWFSGLDKLRTMKNNLSIKDGSTIRTLKDLGDMVKVHRTLAQDNQKKFVLVIDNLHDLVSSYKFESVQNTQRVASFLKRLPQEIHSPVLCTAEVPKSAAGIPTGKDIKESIDLWYASRFVGGIYSNLHSNPETHLKWTHPDTGMNMPIMQIRVSKNQTGEALHGDLFYKFCFYNNVLEECTEEEMDLLAKGQFLDFA